MTQFQYDVICKLIDAGAPALADELKSAIMSVVQNFNAVLEENAKLKQQLETLQASSEPTVAAE